MQFQFVGTDVLNLAGGVLIVGAYKDQTLSQIGQVVDEAMSHLLQDFLKDIHFEAEAGKVAFMPGHGQVKFKQIVVVGLGEKGELEADTVRIAAATGLKKAKELKNDDVYFELLGAENLGSRAGQYLAEGVLLGGYQFKKYKKPKKDIIRIEEVKILTDEKVREELKLGNILASAANFVRDIANEPGNVIAPKDLAEIAQKLAEETGLKCTIYNEKDLQTKKMAGILAVGQGSAHPPCFIHLTYQPEHASKRIVVIGKGITFDSGGLDIKPEQFMKTMKCDKSGACAVLGIMKAIADLKLNIEVHGLIPTAENMPGGNAFRPDDIIVFKNGKSVEIHSTDAEGRLILADALIYGSELKPDVMIDMATLTGACMVALGRFTTGVFSPDKDLAAKIKKIGQITGEKFWELPLDDDLKEDLKGTFTDIKNVGSRYGGAITAALFLKEFVSEEIKSWVHLDIAGPAFLEKPWKYYAEGATGVPVRSILTLLLEESEKR
ncbi:MAG: leucyl aminopeptidase [Candidatus Desulfofervidaceae bacterium]|nr:leucyl aminopeptidase [Candidatus Desulfofervidaceae bacterium]